MQIEIIGYEEKRTIHQEWNASRSRIERLIPSKTCRFLHLRFPDGSVEVVRATKAAVDKFIAASH